MSVIHDFRIPTYEQFRKWKTDFLIDYLINIHHAFLAETIPWVEEHLSAMMQTHSGKYPELYRLQELYAEFAKTVRSHMRHEEDVIFPYIKQIVVAHRNQEPYASLFVKTLRKPLNNMEKEHERIFYQLERLNTYRRYFQVPECACTRYFALCRKLHDLAASLNEQLELENNILFPRAIEIENELLGA